MQLCKHTGGARRLLMGKVDGPARPGSVCSAEPGVGVIGQRLRLVIMRRLFAHCAVVAAMAVLVGCGSSVPEGADPEQIKATEPPAISQCRNLTREVMELPTDSTPTVDCSDPHNAETFASGTLPDRLLKVEYADPALDTWAAGKCFTALQEHLGASESILMRSVFTSVWFRPSEQAWADGARWWRCDLLAGGDRGQRFLDLPTSTTGLLGDALADKWMACTKGDDVNTSARVTCNKKHVWRAVTTIKVGEPTDPWPGAAAVEAKTKQYCSSSVGAWLGYPTDHHFAYTWFGEAEWASGIRRSVCWAKTDS